MPQGLQIEILTDAGTVTSGNFSPGNILYKNETGFFYPSYNPSGFTTGNAGSAYNPANVSIAGGTIDGVTIGESSPSVATFSLAQISPGGVMIMDGAGGGAQMYLFQKNNHEIVWCFNVNPQDDSINDSNNDAFKFGIQGTDGYNGLKLQGQTPQSSWNGQDLWGIDTAGNMFTIGSLVTPFIRGGDYDLELVGGIQSGGGADIILQRDGEIVFNRTGVGEIARFDSSGKLTFSGTTSSFPSIKRAGSILQIRLADDSDFTDLQINTLISNSLQGSEEISAVAATGSFIINGSPVDGQIIEINDGIQSIAFTYRNSPSLPNDFGLVNNIPSWFATVVQDSGLNISVSYDGNVTVSFTNNTAGTSGNIALTSNLDNIIVNGMSGGADPIYYWLMSNTGDLSVKGKINISTNTPSSSTDSGIAGTITWDVNFIYVCVATNIWKRTAISTW